MTSLTSELCFLLREKMDPEEIVEYLEISSDVLVDALVDYIEDWIEEKGWETDGNFIADFE